MGLIANDIYKGSEDVYKIYEGDSLIYEKPSNGIMDYFHIWATGGPAGKVGHVTLIHGYGGNLHKSVALEYSYDGITWSHTEWTSTGVDLDLHINYDETTGDPIYEYIYLRGNNPGGFNRYDDHSNIHSPNYFSITDTTENKKANIHVGGNIMSLLYSDDFRDKYSLPVSNCFTNLFKYDLYSAADLKLPAIDLTENCYYEMFKDNTNLVYGPKVLPANNLVDSCYTGMFSGCTSLIKAPDLPAQNLADWCYMSMFGGCTSLIKAPVLAAKSLYGPNGNPWGMEMYYSIFSGCSSLNDITILFEKPKKIDRSIMHIMQFWVQGVAPNGVLRKKRGVQLYTEYPENGHGIPVGWTVIEID